MAKQYILALYWHASAGAGYPEIISAHGSRDAAMNTAHALNFAAISNGFGREKAESMRAAVGYDCGMTWEALPNEARNKWRASGHLDQASHGFLVTEIDLPTFGRLVIKGD